MAKRVLTIGYEAYVAAIVSTDIFRFVKVRTRKKRCNPPQANKKQSTGKYPGKPRLLRVS